jgi:hypothetical protein
MSKKERTYSNIGPFFNAIFLATAFFGKKVCVLTQEKSLVFFVR